MSKISKQPKAAPLQKANPTSTVSTPAIPLTQTENLGILGNILKGYIPYIIIIIGSIALYANTFHHQNALDDGIAIAKNEYVLRGLKGIPDIFSKDLFDSY